MAMSAMYAYPQENEALRNLMVNYIPSSCDELQLRQIFEMYGPIESIKIVADKETRQSRGYGFVKYRYAFSASYALQLLNGFPVGNKRLKVAYANQGEAQKAAMQAQDTPAVDQMDPNYMSWMQQMQQMQYMHQLSAMQMMQYQQMAFLQQPGAATAEQATPAPALVGEPKPDEQSS